MYLDKIVKHWNDKAGKGKIECDTKQCPYCEGIPDTFKFCELRSKTFLALVAKSVWSFKGFTLRWRCPLCGHRFTQQPPWGLPRKRYVKYVILLRCWRYLRKAKASYRSVMSGTSYPGDDKWASHTRVWHWLKDLGQLVETLRQVKSLIHAKNPGTSNVGQIIIIWPWKYRSQGRQDLLKNAYSLLKLRFEWSKLFSVAFPPIFGTSTF